MGKYKNLEILRQESQYGTTEQAEPVFDQTIVHTKEDLIQTFKAMKQLLLAVKNMEMPQEQLLLNSGYLTRAFENDEQNNNGKKLSSLLIKQKQSKEYFENLREKRKLKSQDLPFIKSIYYDAEQSDLYLESKTDEFNNNRKNYPYLDMVLPKGKISEADLYMFAVGTLTRGFSEQRKNEKLAFKNAKAMLKRVNEQVALLKGKKTPALLKFEAELESKLNSFWLLKQNSIDIANAIDTDFSAEQLFERYVARNSQTLHVDAKQTWDIASAQDLFLVANLNAKQTEEQNKFETQGADATVGQASQMQLAQLEPEIAAKNNSPEKLTQLAFVLEGENIGQIVEKPSKKQQTYEK